MKTLKISLVYNKFNKCKTAEICSSLQFFWYLSTCSELFMYLQNDVKQLVILLRIQVDEVTKQKWDLESAQAKNVFKFV